MEGLQWAFNHFETIISNFGIIGGLVFTAISLRSETKTRRVANLLSVTANHREIWSNLLNHPEIARVLKKDADPNANPIDVKEEVFVTTVILHLSSAFYALKDDLLIKEEGLMADVAEFFSHPIPAAVWEKMKPFQNEKFVRFVEDSQKANNGNVQVKF